MRWTRRSNRKALKVLALAFAASASFAGNATAAQVHDGGSNVPSFEPILSVAQQYGGTAELPAAVSGAAGDALIVADGTSCRHQIAHGAGREAVHPMVVLAEAL